MAVRFSRLLLQATPLAMMAPKSMVSSRQQPTFKSSSMGSRILLRKENGLTRAAQSNHAGAAPQGPGGLSVCEVEVRLRYCPIREVINMSTADTDRQQMKQR